MWIRIGEAKKQVRKAKDSLEHALYYFEGWRQNGILSQKTEEKLNSRCACWPERAGHGTCHMPLFLQGPHVGILLFLMLFGNTGKVEPFAKENKGAFETEIYRQWTLKGPFLQWNTNKINNKKSNQDNASHIIESKGNRIRNMFTACCFLISFAKIRNSRSENPFLKTLRDPFFEALKGRVPETAHLKRALGAVGPSPAAAN